MKLNIDVPDGASGIWKVESFTVSETQSQATRLRAMLKGRGYVPPGDYKRLLRGNTYVMSNTPDEIMDFRFLRRSLGSVLINGLGLGCTIKILLDKHDVTDITVIEISEDVIKLVAPTYLKDKRVTIIQGNAFDWKPPIGKKYDFVWHDIWDNICADNLPEMHKLHRKYGRRTKNQESWCKDRCQRLKQSHF